MFKYQLVIKNVFAWQFLLLNVFLCFYKTCLTEFCFCFDCILSLNEMHLFQIKTCFWGADEFPSFCWVQSRMSCSVYISLSLVGPGSPAWCHQNCVSLMFLYWILQFFVCRLGNWFCSKHLIKLKITSSFIKIKTNLWLKSDGPSSEGFANH